MEVPRPFSDYLLVIRAAEAVRFGVVREPEVPDHCPLALKDVALKRDGPA